MFKQLKLYIQKMLVVKGSNFVHAEEFLLILNSNFLFFFFLSICKLVTFLMLPVSSLSTILFTIKLSRAKKKLWRNLALVNLKLKK